MGKFICLFLCLPLVLMSCTATNSAYKERTCCFLNESKDTIFFNCRNEFPVKVQVVVKFPLENRLLLQIDSTITGKRTLPLDFIYNRISKENLVDKYFHIIVISNKKNHEKSDYWFILNNNEILANKITYSYNKTGR
jgi:hypothetical protein